MYENLIIGVDGRERRLVGDQAPVLVRHTPETVAIAPVGFAGRPHRPARVGVAFDGSAESVVALAHGGLLAEERNCEMVVLTVEDSDRIDALAVARWQERHPGAGAYGAR